MIPYILSFLSIVSFVFLLFRKPKAETYLLFVLFAIPFMELKIVPSYYGGFKAFDIISYLALFFLFNDFLTVRDRLKNSFYLILSLLFIVITVLGKIYSEFVADGIVVILQILPIFIFARFLTLYCQTYWSDRFKLIRALKAGFMVSVAFIVLQLLFGLGISFYGDLNPNTFNEASGVIRYPGFFDDSQVNGQYLAMGSFIFLILEKGGTIKNKRINYLFFILTVVGILLAGSRSPLGGFLIGCTILVFLAGKKIRTYGMILGVLSILVYMLFASQLHIFNRSKNLSDDYLFRESIWTETFDIIKERPLLGIGVGNYENYTKKYNQNLFVEIEGNEIIFLDQPENGYLKILVEHGIVVFAIFVIFLILPILKNLIAFQYINKKEVVFLVASLCSWLVAFSTVYSISDYRLLLVVTTCICLLIANYNNLGTSNEVILNAETES